jgi:hypothetical protein
MPTKPWVWRKEQRMGICSKIVYISTRQGDKFLRAIVQYDDYNNNNNNNNKFYSKLLLVDNTLNAFTTIK